jgi:teichoic acid transport system permease protein
VSGAQLAAEAGLQPVDRRPPLGSYLRSVWQRRAFIRAFATAKTEAENSRSRLGQLWQVLDPVFTMAIYWFLFGFLLGGRGSVENYTGFLAAGVFSFALIRQSITVGSRAISGNLGLVRAIHFPRAVLPLAVVVKQFRVFMISIPLMLIILLITGERVTWNWLLAPVGLLLMTMFAIGMAFIFARMVAAVQDVADVLPYFLRIWGYMSGVMIPIADRLDRLGVPPWAVFIIEVNPGTVYLNIMRDALMNTYDAPGGALNWGLAVAWSVVILVFGLWWFWRAESKYGRG